MTRVRDKSMGDCVKSGLGTTLCKYGMYILKVGHPQFSSVKSWWAFSYFHFVSSFCRSIYHSVVSRSSRFTVSSFRFVVLALELRWTVNNSAVIHIDSMLHESVGQFARIPATNPRPCRNHGLKTSYHDCFLRFSLCPHVKGVFGHQKCRFSKTVPIVGFFKKAGVSFTGDG